MSDKHRVQEIVVEVTPPKPVGLRELDRSQPCEKCGQRLGTEMWLGNGGALAVAHGFYQMWCKLCAVRAQLDFATDQAKRIPKLQEALSRLGSAA